MAFTTEPTAAVFDAINTTIAGDTGAGGLNNTSSTAYLRVVLRAGDWQEGTLNDWPLLVVEMTPSGDDSTGVFRVHFNVRFRLITERPDPSGSPFQKPNAVWARMLTKFDLASLSSATYTDWSFNKMRRVRGPVDFGGSRHQRIQVCDYEVEVRNIN